ATPGGRRPVRYGGFRCERRVARGRGAPAGRGGDLSVREHAHRPADLGAAAQGLPGVVVAVLPHLLAGGAGRVARQRQRPRVRLRCRERSQLLDRLDPPGGSAHPWAHGAGSASGARRFVHHRLEQLPRRGGGRGFGWVAPLKPWLDSLDKACGCTVVRLDAGDEMQGTPISNFTYGRATIEAMNGLGLDAAAIGNHEFDWSVDTLRARMQEARYPFVSANITDSAGTARPDWAEPWKLIQRGGLKVAVIGLTTTSTPTTTAPRNVRGRGH